MITIRLLAILSLASLELQAQHIVVDTISKQSLFIRFNPLMLANLSDATVSAGAEFRYDKKWSIALDAGYIFYSHEYERSARTRGLLIRPAIKYFPNGKTFYLEAELHYKQVNYNFHDWVGRNPVNGVPSYFEYARYKWQKQVFGPHIKAGRLMQVSNRFWLDMYLGIGVHFKTFRTIRNEDPGAQFLDILGNVYQPGDKDEVLAVPIGVRLLYRLQ